MLKRYWIRFKDNPGYSGLHEVFGLGVGVTAFNIEDAKAILTEKMFSKGLPKICCINENVKYDDLDKGHVHPNMGVITNRGIWFPLGFK